MRHVLQSDDAFYFRELQRLIYIYTTAEKIQPRAIEIECKLGQRLTRTPSRTRDNIFAIRNEFVFARSRSLCESYAKCMYAYMYVYLIDLICVSEDYRTQFERFG